MRQRAFIMSPLVAALVMVCFMNWGFRVTYAQPLTLENRARNVWNINRAWCFTLGDPQEAGTETFRDDAWQNVGLPHSFNVPYFLSSDCYVGYGWYRKHLMLPENIAGKRLFLEFDGVFQEAEVFVNARRIGAHTGGYTGFSLDVTDALRPGDNLIAVRVNNLWKPDLAPRAGEHTFGGGIYRDVRLVAVEPVHITWYGVAITTPQVSRDSAQLSVRTEICNQSAQDAVVSVRQRLLDSDGAKVAEFQKDLSLPAGGTQELTQSSEPIAHPRLWHPDHPNLYRLHTALLVNGAVVDEVQNSVGFRWFEWTRDRGFFLNGEHLYLRGANVHQDHAGWSDAVTHAGMERDVKLIKDAGFNFIRGSHYPHSPAFVEACDRLGILFWSENAFWGIGGFQKDGYWNSSAYPPEEKDQPGFEASVKQQLAEMIRIHRNHPSIVAWSMSNEPFFSAPQVMPKVKTFLGDLVALSHTLDPTRPAAIGGAQRPLGAGRIDRVGDIAGYNGDGASVHEFQNPGVANIVSEYGSTTADRPGTLSPGWGDLARDNGEPVHPWRSGQAIWCGMDHGSIAGAMLGKMGIVDYFRIPKRAWYWYRHAYAQQPLPDWPKPGTPAQIKIAADKTRAIQTDGTDDVMLTVTILDASGHALSNAVPVELSVISGPGEFPTGASILFEPHSDIRIQDGQAAIEFRSYEAGTTVIRATSAGLKSDDLTLDFVGPVAHQENAAAHIRRPYVRYVRPKTIDTLLTLGPNNPAFASSSAPGSSAGLAVDGQPQTSWTPADNDAEPAWMLDMEKYIQIKDVALTFRNAESVSFSIRVSSDRKNWQTVVPRANGSSRDRTLVLTPATQAAGRFVEIRFEKFVPPLRPQLGEVAIRGVLLPNP